MQQIIQQLLSNQIKDIDALKEAKRAFASEKKLASLPSNIQLLKTYRDMLAKKMITRDKQVEQLLKKRAIRSSSGIVAIQVLTKPYPCPGQCIFCPNDPTMPKSYIKSEPGAMRALLNHFDPTKQVRNRLTSLTLTGHDTDKIEMIVLGGTWDVYSEKYKTDFIKALYDACNSFSELKIEDGTPQNCGGELKVGDESNQRFKYTLSGKEKIKPSKTIQEAIKRNESAPHRIIGLTIETRPEYVTDKNCIKRRELGVTRIEMGIQSLDNAVLKANKRGLEVEQIRRACHKLRQYGFKFSVHIMPGLYTSTYAKDLKTFEDLYTDPFLKPDEIKFYPTSVIPNTELCKLYKQGKYKPLETSEIKKLIIQTFLHVIPPYTRIKRLIRDIPANEIVAGSKITNLSQLVHDKMKSDVLSKKLNMKEFYGRLYGDYKLFKTVKESLLVIANEMKQSNRGDNKNTKIASSATRNDSMGIYTAIIGIKPDISKQRNFVSLDTRSREIRNKVETLRGGDVEKGNKIANIVIRTYASSVGQEYFMSFEDELGYLYGFARLLLPRAEETIQMKGLGKETAIIRELHIYGNMETLKSTPLRVKTHCMRLSGASTKSSVGNDEKSENANAQHTGFGRQLMDLAEKISKQAHYKKLSVISGIGVRAYYRKLGYKLEGSYMVKKI